MFMPEGPFTGAPVGDAGALATGLLLLSHAPFVPALLYNYRRLHWYLGTVCLLLLVSSCMYHACRGGVACFGVQPDLLRRNDHVTALHGVGGLALHLLQYDRLNDHPSYEVGALARYILPFVCFLAVLSWPFALQSAVLVAGYLVVVAAARYLWDDVDVSTHPADYQRRTLRAAAAVHRAPPAQVFLPRWVALGALAALLGVGCYFYDSGTRASDTLADGLVHSLWHALIGFAFWAFSRAVDDHVL